MSTHKADDGPGIKDGNRLLRACLVLAMIILVAILVLGASNRIEELSTLLAAVLLACCVGVHVWVASYKPTRLNHGNKMDGYLDLRSLESEAAAYLAKVSNQLIRQYVEAINEPARLRGRVSERIEPLVRAIRQHVSVVVEMPEGGDKYLLFPIMMPVKGDLQDDLQIRLDGASVAALGYQEYLLLTIGSLRSLITAAEVGIVGNPSLTTDEKADLLAKLKAAAEKGVSLVALRARLDDSGKESLGECTQTFDELIPRINDDKAKAALKLAAGLVRTLAGHYAILVVVPKGGTNHQKQIIEYERYRIPSLKLARLSWPNRWRRHPPHKWLKDRLAALLGVRPIYLELELSNAATARSYHLMVIGPDGTYLAAQHLPHGASPGSQGNNGQKVSQPYKRLQRRRGQRYLHLYARAIRRSSAADLKLSVRFYEVPPGSMASTTLAATGAFFLTFLVARIAEGNSLPSGVNLTAILLAFPAVAGIFAGFESKSTGLVSGTLSSRASSLTTIILSLLAVGLSVAQASKTLGRTEHRNILGITDLWWQILTVAALFNILYALYVWVTRTAYFYWLADRPDDQPNDIVERGG